MKVYEDINNYLPLKVLWSNPTENQPSLENGHVNWLSCGYHMTASVIYSQLLLPLFFELERRVGSSQRMVMSCEYFTFSYQEDFFLPFLYFFHILLVHGMICVYF